MVQHYYQASNTIKHYHTGARGTAHEPWCTDEVFAPPQYRWTILQHSQPEVNDFDLGVFISRHVQHILGLDVPVPTTPTMSCHRVYARVERENELPRGCWGRRIK